MWQRRAAGLNAGSFTLQRPVAAPLAWPQPETAP